MQRNIGSFWNAAERKLYVNRTCFHARLKSQTGKSSFHLSCERTLKLETLEKGVKYVQSYLNDIVLNQNQNTKFLPDLDQQKIKGLLC